MNDQLEIVKSLKVMASKLNNLQANLLLISDDKRHSGIWKQWQEKRQTIIDLASFNWDRAKAIAIISGVGDWRCFDLDDVEEPEILKKVIRILGLPADYPWVIKSGSGKGYHIYFKCKLAFPHQLIGKTEVNIYYGKSKNGGFDHLELRWAKCYTLCPPSLHPSGAQYEFISGKIPDAEPAMISDVQRIANVFLELTVTEERKPEPEVKPAGTNEEQIDLKFLPSAIEFLAERLVDYNDWVKCGFALSSLGEEGRKYFLDLSLKNPNYPQDTPEIINKKFDSLLRDKSNHVSINSLFYTAINHGYKYPKIKQDKPKKEKPEKETERKRRMEFSEEFWYEFHDPKGFLALGIDRANFLYFLQSRGFFKMYVSTADYMFIRIQRNIVTEVTPTLIKDFVLDYVKGLPSELTRNFSNIDLYNTVLKGTNVYFSTSYLEFLEPKKIFFHQDIRTEAYFYFKNCWVKVTKDNYITQRYEDLRFYIWEKQIIQRDFVDVKSDLTGYQMSEFQQFLRNVCNNDNDRYYSLMSAVGYLLHTYKDPSLAKAIIFCDEQLSDDANGRSGKSLVGNALSKFRNSVRFDGRNFKQDKAFAFQQVSLDTQIIEFNDVDKKFNFERLFSILTDSIIIEKKGKDEFMIPFDRSPKVLISTNYTIQTDGDSADDRKFEIEFSNHYNKNNKPVDEFGHRFFDDWDSDEWNRFDNYMIACVNYFLSRGLRSYSYVNLSRKKLLQSTNKEFVEFMESEVQLGIEYSKKTVHEAFVKLYPDFTHLKQNTLSGWIKKYAKIIGYKYFEGHRKDYKYFVMYDSDFEKPDEDGDEVELGGRTSDTLF